MESSLLESLLCFYQNIFASALKKERIKAIVGPIRSDYDGKISFNVEIVLLNEDLNHILCVLFKTGESYHATIDAAIKSKLRIAKPGNNILYYTQICSAVYNLPFFDYDGNMFYFEIKNNK